MTGFDVGVLGHSACRRLAGMAGTADAGGGGARVLPLP